VGNPEEKRPLGRPRCRWVANIKIMMIIIFWEMTPCGSYKNHLPEDDNHHSHRRGNLKSYNIKIVHRDRMGWY
jgi:hypothetical protein